METQATGNIFILPLGDPAATTARVGGKGASLARLAAGGFPVPPGFDVTTLAYQRCVAANDLDPARLAADASVDDPASLERAAAAIAARFGQATMPEEIASALLAAYAALGADEPAVAVRSSATAEDLPEFSFAGQQETLLGVRGTTALLDAVRRCWASL